MATSYRVEYNSLPCYGSKYVAVVIKETFTRGVVPYVKTRKRWYVPVSSLDYDDYMAGRRQSYFRTWLMSAIRGVEPDRVERY